jgi:hypothetical protein
MGFMETGATGWASAGERIENSGLVSAGLARSTRHVAHGQALRSIRHVSRWVVPSDHSITSESPSFFNVRGVTEIVMRRVTSGGGWHWTSANSVEPRLVRQCHPGFDFTVFCYADSYEPRRFPDPIIIQFRKLSPKCRATHRYSPQEGPLFDNLRCQNWCNRLRFQWV